MRWRLTLLFSLSGCLLGGCSAEPSPATTPTADAAFSDAARAADDGLQAEVEQLASAAAWRATVQSRALGAIATQQAAEQETTARLAAEAQQAAEEAIAADAARAAASAQAVIDAEGGCPGGWNYDDDLGCTRQDAYPDDFSYDSSDLEVRCSDGTATVEECFGPGSDLNGNGIADVNE